ncbi:MAG TPA: MgtC/SapB family protein [Candidatus Acidoferrales bacterium]|nr:MgtC/SapB family protein [Candidatus Acidoferrales bacterium]
MIDSIFQVIPKEGAQILIVLFLSFLVGIEREEHKAASTNYAFGGVRTYPLFGLLGYILTLISGGQLLLPAVGFVVVGAFLLVSYRHKLEVSSLSGMTSEISGLLTYAVGVLIFKEQYWIATTITVIGVGLLELKGGLENLSQKIPSDEILTFAKFLLLTAVFIPVVPNRTFGPFGFNPFKTWLVIVAVSTISYASYLLLKFAQAHRGIYLSALLGGLYSSTVATVVLAKRAREQSRPHLYSGSILAASGMMYLRLLALLAIFNRGLFHRLAIPFLVLGLLALVGGWAWSHRKEPGAVAPTGHTTPENPLELKAALLFGVLFVGILAITHYALIYLGARGFYILSAIMGVSDVDPFILGLTQSAGTTTPLVLASTGIVIASSSNNLVKGIYARAFAGPKTGNEALTLLIIYALLGLAVLAIY